MCERWGTEIDSVIVVGEYATQEISPSDVMRRYDFVFSWVFSEVPEGRHNVAHPGRGGGRGAIMKSPVGAEQL